MADTKLRPGQSRELVEADLYDDLLSRYERVLVYAGQLREKQRAQEHLHQSVSRLRQRVAVDEAYIRVLENALENLGILSPIGLPEPSTVAKAGLPEP